MKKTDIVNMMSEKTGLNKTDTERTLDAFLDTLCEAIKTEDKVVFVGYFTVRKVDKKATTSRNPKTKEIIHVPAKVTVKMKPGKFLLDAVAK